MGPRNQIFPGEDFPLREADEGINGFSLPGEGDLVRLVGFRQTGTVNGFAVFGVLTHYFYSNSSASEDGPKNQHI